MSQLSASISSWNLSTCETAPYRDNNPSNFWFPQIGVFRKLHGIQGREVAAPELLNPALPYSVIKVVIARPGRHVVHFVGMQLAPQAKA